MTWFSKYATISSKRVNKRRGVDTKDVATRTVELLLKFRLDPSIPIPTFCARNLASSICKLTSCYYKCLKMLFGFKRRDSLNTGILMHLGLPCFNTILSNGCAIFTRCYSSSRNSIVEHLLSVGY